MSATVTISNGTYSVDVELEYNYVSDNTWSCLPGYMGADSGTWTSHKSHQRIKLLNSKGKEMMVLEHVPVNVYVGDPLPHLVGKGPGPCLTPVSGGVLLGSDVEWEF